MKTTPLPAFSVAWSWGFWLWGLLIVAVLGSALAVVWVTHQVRLTSTQLHLALKKDYALRVEQGRLELEYNHLLSRVRIEKLAKEKLGMSLIAPGQERILLLPEDKSTP